MVGERQNGIGRQHGWSHNRSMHGIQPFAHAAELQMDETADIRAPGGAITMSLCGANEHPPPCPLAAHYTDVRRDGETVAVRVLFACRPADVERGPRPDRRGAAVAVSGPTRKGPPVTGACCVRVPRMLLPTERDHGDRLVASTGPG